MNGAQLHYYSGAYKGKTHKAMYFPAFVQSGASVHPGIFPACV